MSYQSKSGIKHERTLGMQAVKDLLADDAWTKEDILEIAKKEETRFAALDEAADDEFCVAMDCMRKQEPDLYRIFWWWRKAHEDAGQKKEEDGESKKEPSYKVFEICQFLAPLWSDDWESDRIHIKSNVKPLITEEQIVAGLDHKSIKRFVWICHNKDVYTEEDEVADRTGRIKAGDPKFLHYHVWIECSPKLPISTIARWFGVPFNQVEVKHGRGAFIDCAEYSVHESPKAVAAGKTHYDDDVVRYSGFDFRKEIDDLQANRKKFGRRAAGMTPEETMRDHVLRDGWTLRQCRIDDPITYAKIRSQLQPLRLDYLLDSDPCPLRLNLYVDGLSGLGKSAFCEYIAEALFPGVDHPYFAIGNDEKVTFDGYDGEPVIIWDDMRAEDYVRQFSVNGTFKLLDPHPKKIAQQAKHSRVILTNFFNIINGVQPYDQFITDLTRLHRGKYGMREEDENQAWRRIPMILRVDADNFDILINRGFVTGDLRAVKTMELYANVRGSMRQLTQGFGGEAKMQLVTHAVKPVMEAVKLLETAHDDKITDPNEIPPEFSDFGKVTYGSEIAALYQAELEQAREKEVKKNFDLLTHFAEWVWKPVDYTRYSNFSRTNLAIDGTFAQYLVIQTGECDLSRADISELATEYVSWAFDGAELPKNYGDEDYGEAYFSASEREMPIDRALYRFAIYVKDFYRLTCGLAEIRLRVSSFGYDVMRKAVDYQRLLLEIHRNAHIVGEDVPKLSIEEEDRSLAEMGITVDRSRTITPDSNNMVS